MPTTGRIHSGEWRPDEDFNARDGLKVTLRRARGITSPDVLKVPFRLQVPPINDFARHYSVPTSKVQTLRLGTKSRSMGADLMALTVSTFFLDGAAQDDVSRNLVVWPYKPFPQRMIRELRWVMGKAPGAVAQPFRLTISQMGVWPGEWLVNGIFVLTDMTATQKGGDVGVESIDLSFEEWGGLDVERRRQGAETETKRTYRFGQSIPKDASLHGLAQHYFHRPSEWGAIARANGVHGVAASSEAQLAAWAKKHHRSTLEIPPAPRRAVA